MNLNSIIFPAPSGDKRFELFSKKDELIFIPKVSTKGVSSHIPCLYQLSRQNPETSKVLFYFHGNAEDIFNCASTLETVRKHLPV